MFNSQKINTDPKFDNNPNPLLEAFRADCNEVELSAARNACGWLGGDQMEFFEEAGWPQEHVDHARKVLQRLARLAQAQEG